MKRVNVKLVVAILITFLMVVFIETLAHASHVGEEVTLDQEVLASTATLSQHDCSRPHLHVASL